MKIEVEWKATPASGFDEFTLEELEVKNKKEWDSLKDSEKELIIKDALLERNQSLIEFVPFHGKSFL